MYRALLLSFILLSPLQAQEQIQEQKTAVEYRQANITIMVPEKNHFKYIKPHPYSQKLAFHYDTKHIHILKQGLIGVLWERLPINPDLMAICQKQIKEFERDLKSGRISGYYVPPYAFRTPSGICGLTYYLKFTECPQNPLREIRYFIFPNNRNEYVVITAKGSQIEKLSQTIIKGLNLIPLKL